MNTIESSYVSASRDSVTRVHVTIFKKLKLLNNRNDNHMFKSNHYKMYAMIAYLNSTFTQKK